MVFDSTRFIEVTHPVSLFSRWIVLVLLTVYYVVGWLTFSLFVLSLVVQIGTADGRTPVEVVSTAIPYLLPLAALLLGVLLSSALGSALFSRGILLGFFAQRTPALLLVATVANIFLASLLLASGGFFSSGGGEGFFESVVRVVVGIAWLLVAFLFFITRELRKRSADFLRTLARILLEGHVSLVSPVVMTAVVASFAAAAAIGNAFTLVAALLLPVLWAVPEYDVWFGPLLDAHPFISYLFITSDAEFIFVLLFVPVLSFWFIFVNSLVVLWLRAFLSAAVYQWLRQGTADMSDALWTASTRLRSLIKYALSPLAFRPFLATRFMVQAIVVQKSTLFEAALNSFSIASTYVPPAAWRNIFFVGAAFPVLLLACLSSAGGMLLLHVVFSAGFAASVIFGLFLLLVVILPSLITLCAAGVYYRTLLYAWCLDQEFPKREESVFPSSVQSLFHELHTVELSEAGVEAKELVGSFTPTPPEQ